MNLRSHKLRTLFAVVLLVAVFIGIGTAIDHGKHLPPQVHTNQGPLPVMPSGTP